MAFVLVSCNQRNRENNPDNHMMGNGNMMHNDSTMMQNDSTRMHRRGSMMGNHNGYSCPMHPAIQGKMNDKCSQCGMKLNTTVPKKATESK